MIEGNPHILPEALQVIAMVEAEKRREGVSEEVKNPKLAGPTFGQLLRNTFYCLVGKNIPT